MALARSRAAARLATRAPAARAPALKTRQSRHRFRARLARLAPTSAARSPTPPFLGPPFLGPGQSAGGGEVAIQDEEEEEEGLAEVAEVGVWPGLKEGVSDTAVSDSSLPSSLESPPSKETDRREAPRWLLGVALD